MRLTAGESPAKLASLLEQLRAVDVKRFETVAGLYVVTLPETLDVWEAGALAQELDDVAYAEPNYRVTTQATPNDPSFGSLWGLNNTGQSGGSVHADIRAPQAWNITTGSSDVVVALLDTGIDYTHPDLAANMFRNDADCNANGVDDDGNGYIDDCFGIDTANHDSDPFDDQYHGTHTAGTVGAAGNNGIGVVGVNWNVKLMPCKFLSATGSGNTAGAVTCLDYVAAMKDRGVNIVATSNSWGGGGYSQAMYDAIDAQRQRGILFIAAAANNASNNDTVALYPAGYDLPNVIAVAATTRNDTLASYSNYGRRTVHLGAPGSEILSTTPNNSYQTLSGTSMATPHVAGVAALLKAQDPTRDWRAIRNLILAGGDDNLNLTGTTVTGKRLNASRSLACTNARVFSRLKPVKDSVVTSVGAPVTLSALNINCAAGAGDVTVTVTPGNTTMTLTDTGASPDQSAGDGIYSGVFVPSSTGTFVLTFPNGTTASVQALAAPTIVVQPLSQTIVTGQTATLSVAAAGTPTLTYQWYACGSGCSPIAGATASSFTTQALTTTSSYWVRVSNAFGSADSTTAVITIGTAPAITTQPQDKAILSGQAATLSVVASGTSPIAYQWYVGASGTTTSRIVAATSSSYTTPALTTATSYWVRVSNAYGSPVNSNTAAITIGAMLTGHIRNASTSAPIAGATVTLNPGGLSATTDSSGVYSKVVASNSYLIASSANDYLSSSASAVFLTAGATVTRDFSLTPIVYVPAVYDATIKAPACDAIGSACDSGTLLVGRDTMINGPEPHQPNTINDSCADGTLGTFHGDESIDRITVSTTTGDSFAPGRTVKIAVTAWVWGPVDYLDVYYTANASNPAWTYITTINPAAIGAQTLTTSYVLPTGGLQAVRANFRFLQNPGACTLGAYDDRDDLVFSVATVPGITTHPQGQTVASGHTAALSVAAAGSAPLSYQWYLGTSGTMTSPIAGATSSSYTTPALTNTTSYWVRVSNSYGNPADSNTATITVTVPPGITTQPQGRTIRGGEAVSLSVAATGSGPLSYKWYIGTSGTTTIPIAGATSSSYTTPALMNTTRYWVRVSNPYSVPADSTTATITVAWPPAITTTNPLPAATAASAYSVTVQAIGGATPYTWSIISSTGPPPGFTVDSSTGAITSIPNAAGSFTLVVRATSADALFADKTFTLTVAAVTDSLLAQQWHLAERTVEVAGANVRPVWPVTRGAGIVIGVVDDGVQGTHPDLQANYVAALSHDFRDHDNDPSPVTSGPCETTADCRGTLVAGIAAARNDNGAGGSGVAPLASLAGIRLAAHATDADEASALTHELSAVHIENISRRDADDGTTLVTPGPQATSALLTGVATGRSSRGRIFVLAAGDGRANSDNCNFDGYANSRYVIAVGAVDDTGQQAPYSESCSALLVSAPSSGVPGVDRSLTTTDLAGADGDNAGDYTARFGGTSAAAPVVSGVVALMLARNPLLTWRDVQHILVRSSRQVNASDPSWTTGPLPHSEKYGFGVVDALAAATRAATWTNVAPETALPSVVHSLGVTIPDNDATGVSDSLSIGSEYAGFLVEHVEVAFSATHAHRGDLDVTLTSPSGVVSHLATARPGDAGANFPLWRFRSVRHWGETAAGTWKLTVTDRGSGTVGSFNSWILNIFGTAPSPLPPAAPSTPAPPSGGGGGRRGGGGGEAPAPVPAPAPEPTPDTVPRLAPRPAPTPTPMPALTPAPTPTPAPTSAGPGAPTALTVSVFGTTIVLSWTAGSGAPSTYILEAGSASGLSNVIVYPTGNAAPSYTATEVGPGTYFVRVRAANAQGTSAPSNEVAFAIGTGSVPPSTDGPPGPPLGLAASASGSTLSLLWNPPALGGSPSSYVIQAGSGTGLSDLASFSTGSTATSLTAGGVPAGTYFLRVRAANDSGVSAPSNEAVIVVGGGGGPAPCGGPPDAPGSLQFNVNGSTVTLAWSAAGGSPISYVVEAGSFAGGADLVVSDTGNAGTSLTAAGVGAGTYFVRIRGRNACGTSAASNEVIIAVP